MPQEQEFAAAIRAAIARAIPGVTAIERLLRLSGGASQETWSLDALTEKGRIPLILRRRPQGRADAGEGATAVPLETEAEVIRRVAASGVPVPPVPYVCAVEDGIGSAFFMNRIEGETIARKILRDERFARVRPKLARQCGEILARIHRCETAALPPLKVSAGPAQLATYKEIYERFDYPHPIFDLAIAWLKERLEDTPQPVLVHGDFRNGNLMIDESGIAAVLDWELTHLGDPREDLAWICVNSWRFGMSENRVGGFGHLEDLLQAYADAGGVHVTPEEIRVWEVLGSLKWGIMCMTMYGAFATGADRSIERAAIGRRASEAEIDLVNLLIPRRAAS
ncbi:MAG: phosphotransferase family protein [Alphaproteobacteria bacterium]|nr:phosphotransferase family protein [Alphaproteobacteria bacterium]